MTNDEFQGVKNALLIARLALLVQEVVPVLEQACCHMPQYQYREHMKELAERAKRTLDEVQGK